MAINRYKQRISAAPTSREEMVTIRHAGPQASLSARIFSGR